MRSSSPRPRASSPPTKPTPPRTPCHLYSFPLAPNDWDRHFEMRPELEDFFARTHGLIGALPHTRFGTEVVRAGYDERRAIWHAELRGPDGARESQTFNVIISAVGVLNRAKLPRLPGTDSFPGPSFHSSYWPSGLDVSGMRVAVIGSGASAMQIVPAIAGQVAQLTVFQRTPPWAAPFEKFKHPIHPYTRYLLPSCPLHRAWYFL